MAKTKPRTHPSKSRDKDVLRTTNGSLKPKQPKKPVEELAAEAAALLQQSQPDLALPLAEKTVRRLENQTSTSINLASSICLLAAIQLELGDVDTARTNFTRAVDIDPIGAYIGADALLWLAQLCEEGGQKSVDLFERANHVLREIINDLEGEIKRAAEAQLELIELKRKLSDALCSMAEIYMTDLSLEADAEAKCEALVTEALLITPDSPSALQTLASVRISQLKTADAQAALIRSLGVWENLPPEDVMVPDFPTRISLARLLMEVQMEGRAMEVLERLVGEDDQSVEAWYLGGWCQVLLAEKLAEDESGTGDMQKGAREWLKSCLRVYEVLEYEDERLRDHAMELVTALNKKLGVEEEGDEEEEWQDESNGSEGDDLEATDRDGDAEMT
jgi:tetratricopeptide (TPR) repeat protein